MVVAGPGARDTCPGAKAGRVLAGMQVHVYTW